MNKNDQRRKRLIAAIHILAPRIFSAEVQRRKWMRDKVGVSSCKDCTLKQIEFLHAKLRNLNDELERNNHSGLENAVQSLSREQERKIGALSRQMGWNGLHDMRLRNFIVHTLRLSHSHFAVPSNLSKRNASYIIIGLERWLNNIKRQSSGGFN